jgi:Flp pilus assembly protein TadD
VSAISGAWELRVVRADALRSLGRLDDALGDARLAVMLSPEEPSAHNMLGAVLFQLGRVDEAFPEFSRAREIDPNDRDYAENVFRAQFARGRMAEACATWAAAQRLAGRGNPGVRAAALRLRCRP